MFTDLGSLLFFSVAQAYIRSRFIDLMDGAYANILSVLAFIITTLLTIWILVHGFRIMTGRSSEPLMGFFLKAGKATVICAVAFSSGFFNVSINDWLLGDGTHSNIGLRGSITEMVTGSADDPYTQVNDNLKLTQTILSAMNTLTTGGEGQIEGNTGSSSLWMSGFGQAGPAVVGGTLILLNEIGFYLGFMFSPLMILSLLSDQTKQFFWGWVKYMVALCFSMAVLVLVTSIALQMTIKYGMAVVGASLLTSVLGQAGESNSMAATAMQQGGLGMLLTALIISVPPMVMNFFSAQLGAIGAGQNMMGSLGHQVRVSDTSKLSSTNNQTNSTQSLQTADTGGRSTSSQTGSQTTQPYSLGSNATPTSNGDSVKSSGESRGAAASAGNNNSPIAQLGQNIRQSMGLDGGTTGQAAKVDAGSVNSSQATGLNAQTQNIASSDIGGDSAAIKQKYSSA